MAAPSVPVRKLEERLPFAQYQVVLVAFNVANTNVTVPHNLQPVHVGDVMYKVIDSNAGGVVYRALPAGQGYINLQASVAGTYRILLFTVAHLENVAGLVVGA